MIFEEAHRKKRNPAFLEKEYRFLQTDGNGEELEKYMNKPNAEAAHVEHEKPTASRHS